MPGVTTPWVNRATPDATDAPPVFAEGAYADADGRPAIRWRTQGLR